MPDSGARPRSGGTLLAACEGRRSGPLDDADTDVLLRRSTDGGATWSEARVIVADDAHATLGNPTLVVDRVTGVTFLFVCRNNERVLVARSADDGVTWSAPLDLTGEVVRPSWSWVGTGPGSGIQLTQGSAKGRLLLPVSHQDGGTPDDRKSDHRRTHVLYSDDHGETWRLSDTISALTSEAAVAELADGTLVLNMRNHLAVRRRRVARSRDGGTTWTHAVNHPRLTDPDCHASLLRWPEPPEIGAESVLLFANPATSRKRERLTVRLSEDGGKTWPVEKMLHAGEAAIRPSPCCRTRASVSSTRRER